MTEPTFLDLHELEERLRVPPGELERIVRGLVELYDPLRVYLFGSFAWGTPRWYSDLDFCVVVRTDEEADEIEKALNLLGSFMKRDTDFYLCSKKQFEKYLSNPGTMQFKIFHDANVLYAAANVVFETNQPLYREEHDLLNKAENNLLLARSALDHPVKSMPEECLHHVQQSIEFSLRAFRCFHLQPIFKTHKLDMLRKMCLKIDPGLKTVEGFSDWAAQRITRYYLLRYNQTVKIPVSLAGVEKEMAIAERVYEFVKHYIETTEPPTEPTVVADDGDDDEACHPRAGGDPNE